MLTIARGARTPVLLATLIGPLFGGTGGTGGPGSTGDCTAHAGVQPQSLTSQGSGGGGPFVQAPEGWYSGDTHAHVQPCGDDPDLSLAELFQQQLDAELDMNWLLYWGVDGALPYINTYAPLVNGLENPVSAGDPDHFVQEAVEVSKFASSQFGHQIGLCIDDALFPNAKHPAPVLEFFASQPDAVTGYAHVRWHNDYDDVDPASNFHTGTSMGPVDTALGRVDFLEASIWDTSNQLDIRGMLYKLWNCGMRVGLSGGSDNLCIYPDIGAFRNWVLLEEGQTLSPKTWAAALANGRSTMSVGGKVFIDLRVDTARIGEEVTLPEAGTVQVRVKVTGTPDATGDAMVQLVQAGEVLAAQLIPIPQGTVTFNATLPVGESTWFAASLDGHAHSGAVWVTVADRPIARRGDASYWIKMLEGLHDNLGPPFDTVGEETAIQAEIQDAIDVYKAVRVASTVPPTGTTPVGLSTPACDGPVNLGATGAASAGDLDFALTNLHGPPDAVGVLVLGSTLLDPGLPVSGANLHVTDFLQVLPASTHAGGFATVPVPLAAGTAGAEFYAQYLWVNPEGCGTAELSASNGLRVVVQ